jgi:surface antigen
MLRRISSFSLCLAVLALAGCAGTSGPEVSAVSALAPVGPSETAGGVASFPADLAVVGLDAADRRAAETALADAMENGRIGVPVAWRNARSGHSGEIVPGAGYQVNTYDCRGFTETVVAGGRAQTLRGTACKQADGSWKPLV